MLTKSFHAFFKGDYRLANKCLAKLKDMKIDLRDIRCLYRHTHYYRNGKCDIVATVKGNWHDYDFTLATEAKS